MLSSGAKYGHLGKLLHRLTHYMFWGRINIFFSSSLVCKFKAHKRCAVRATNNCKWTTLASIGKDIIEDEDGVGNRLNSSSFILMWKHWYVLYSFLLCTNSRFCLYVLVMWERPLLSEHEILCEKRCEDSLIGRDSCYGPGKLRLNNWRHGEPGLSFGKRKVDEWLEQYLSIWDVWCKSVFPG